MCRHGAGGLRLPHSLNFWHQRLDQHGFAPRYTEHFGDRLLRFKHPCGLDYELVGITDDTRKPYSNGDVPADLAIRGTHSITVNVREMDASEEFMESGWSGKPIATDGKYVRYAFGDGGPGKLVDFALEPALPQASWTYGEGLGFTDTSERKDRRYSPSGPPRSWRTWSR